MASYNSIICRYNEIATKGNNRSMFENMLIRNMKRMTKEHVSGLNFVKMRGISCTGAPCYGIINLSNMPFGQTGRSYPPVETGVVN